MRRAAHIAAGGLLLLLVCTPLAFALTIALFPSWGWVERRWGIESVGHSGPAEWCFWTVYALCVLGGAALVATYRRGGE